MKLINIAAVGAALLSMLTQAHALIMPAGGSSPDDLQGEASSVAPVSAPVSAKQKRATPRSSPASWFFPDDYPAPALAEGGGGTTGFRLSIDETGAVYGCDIISSSGIEMLDQKTCALLRERAQFEPARDDQGIATKDVYTSRVVWRMQPGSALPLVNNILNFELGISQQGEVVSCQINPLSTDRFANASCPSGLPLPIALKLREGVDGETANVHMEMAFLFDEASASARFAGKAGFKIIGAGLWHFDISEAGAVTDCQLKRQKGEAMVLPQGCHIVYRRRFQPDAVPPGETSKRHGWVLAYFALKSGP